MTVKIVIKLNGLYDETNKLKLLVGLLNYLFVDSYKISTNDKQKEKLIT